MHKLSQEELTIKIRAVIEDTPEVDFAYLFGSWARNRTTPLSDIDIAVYLQGGPQRKTDWRFRLDLLGKLSDAIRSDGVDLVILNESPELLGYEVLKYGIIIHCRNQASRIEYFIQTTKKYCDLAPLRQFHLQAAKQRAKRGVRLGSTSRFAEELDSVRRLFEEAHPAR